jgi:CheY-like chemotaxis protein
MSSFRCPKCNTSSEAIPDAEGAVTCTHCGSRLKPRAPAVSTTGSVNVESLWREMHEIRIMQAEILALLRSRAAGAPAAGGASFPEDDDEKPQPARPVRSGRKKTVLLVDDDEQTRVAAANALDAADVQVRIVADGNKALGAIALEKPDVIAIEPEMGGAMRGKDVVNMIKATMEWVDIPIVLYTRAPIAGTNDARAIHGADELVNKGPDGPKALVACVISLFRKA